jgi:hypothetical protein
MESHPSFDVWANHLGSTDRRHRPCRMMPRSVPPEIVGRVDRCVRWVGIGSHPLRRRMDRAEAWFAVVLAVAVVTCGPFVVWRSGASAHDRAAAAAEWQRSRFFPVRAVLLQDTDDSVPVYGEDGQVPGTVQAEWTAPDGTRRVGPVVPSARGSAGTTVVIWTDRSGNPGERPGSDPVAAAIGVGLFVALLVVTVPVGVLFGLRGWLDRRRMAAWEREWAEFEPRWSGPR